MNASTGSNDRPGGAAISRRAVLASALAASVIPFGAAAFQSTEATPTVATPAEPVALGEAAMPNWRFVVTDFLDPYQGTLTKPEGVPSGTRVVALQLILLNESDQPLEFMVTDFRLRDVDGSEYRAGEYLGTEPRIVSQNLPDGERTRGWVWFGLPESAQAASIVFIAPPPVLRIPLT
jgi:hypothetical protein